MGGESGAVGAVGPPGVEEGEAVEKPKTDLWKLEPQPIREDHVENAVKFLFHPKVRTSPIVHRRSFLEKKGLTGEEIDEAFRRMPDAPSSDIAAPPAVPSSQPVALAQSSGSGRKPRELSWGQKLLGLGAIVTAGAGAGVVTKAYLLPKLRSWVRTILAEESEQDKKISPPPSPSPAPVIEPPPLPPVNEAAVAANAAAAAASEVAAAMREFSHSRSKESLQLGSIIKSLETQTQELKSALSGMRDVVNNAELTTTSATFGRGQRQDPWCTPEMPRPSHCVYVGGAIALPPSETIELAENGTQFEDTDSL